MKLTEYKMQLTSMLSLFRTMSRRNPRNQIPQARMKMRQKRSARRPRKLRKKLNESVRRPTRLRSKLD